MGAITTSGPDLGDLARRINAEHDAALRSFGSALDHARNAGQMLIDAKSALPHGAWLPWIEKNCKFSERTARTYKRIASDWPRLESNRQSVADLSIAKAIEIIAPPKAAKPPISTPGKHVTTVTATARETVGKPPATEQPPSTGRPFIANRRHEPTPEEKAADKLRADLAELLADVIRQWRHDHREATDDLVYEALEDLKNGAVEIV